MKLDDLAALNEEIGALARAGIPLGSGLLEMGNDMPGRLGKTTQDIGQRLAEGQSLDQVLADSSLDIPEAYRAVITAGARSGRLAIAVEKLSGTLKRVAELRRALRLSAIYPILLVLVACFLFAFAVRPAHQQILQILLDDEEINSGWLVKLLSFVGEYGYAAGVLVAIFAIIAWLWWVSASFVSDRSWFGRSTAWLPGVLRVRQLGSRAAFADVLALLVEQEMPLHEAVALAGRTSGDRDIRIDAENLAEHITQGRTDWQPTGSYGIPKIVGWQLTNQVDRNSLCDSLKRMAKSYYFRVEGLAYWIQNQMPIIVAGVIGGIVVFLYAMTAIVPWFIVLRKMGELL